MRRLFWMIILLGGYIWIVTSGNDQTVLDKGKWIYKTVVSWFDDADVDFQVHQKKNKKKSSRRWD